MHNDMLVISIIIGTLLVWFSYFILVVFTKQQSKKISVARTMEDIGGSYCTGAKEKMERFGKLRKKYLLFIIIFSLILLINISANIIFLLRNKTIINYEFYKSAVLIVDPIYFFCWLSAVGGYGIVKQLHKYSVVLHQNCRRLEMKP